MKRMRMLLLTGAIVLACLFAARMTGIGLRTASAQIPTDSPAGYFYDALSPYGNWVYLSTCGWSWYPYNTPIDFRPYSSGQWQYTDYGWTFVSDVPWGWACYHYGRWYLDSTYGWVWCPGTEWAPAWVSWRYNDDWIGWCALPPGVVWTAGVGFAGGIDWDDICRPEWFCFVRTRDFCDPDLRSRTVLFAQNRGLFDETRAHMDYDHRENRIINNLAIQGRIEKAVGHSIARSTLIRTDQLGPGKVSGNEVRMFAPQAPTARDKWLQAQPRQAPATSQAQDLLKQQANEKQQLQQQQAQWQRTLEQQHRAEIARPPANMAPNQLQTRHNTENQAMQQQLQQQRQLLENWHQHEQIIRNAPAAPAPQEQRRYNFNGGGGFSGGNRGSFGGGGRSSFGGGGGRGNRNDR